MRVVTYMGDQSAPAGEEHIARIRTPMPGKKGKLVEDWHPVIFTGPDEASVRERANDWWADELAKEQKRVEAIRARAQARKAA